MVYVFIIKRNKNGIIIFPKKKKNGLFLKAN